jgi:hypothetical protein
VEPVPVLLTVSVARPAVKPAAVPVRLVATPALGVPRSGVVSVGDACITNVVPVPVCAATAVALPVEVIGPVRLAFVVTDPAVRPAAVPVMFVPTSADGVPRFGVVSVGDVARTPEPVPVVVMASIAVPPLLTAVILPPLPVRVGSC